MNPLISVITLTHNKLACTRLCLESWLASTYRPWELLVVDNGSSDETAEWLEEFRNRAGKAGVPVRLIMNGSNVGCSTARNQALDRAEGSRLVFMDNDVALRSRSWMERLKRVLDSDAAVGMAGPKLVYPWPPCRIQFAGGDVTPSGRVCFAGRGELRDDPRFNSFRKVQCFISACCMMSRAAVEATGRLDEAFNPVEYEDIDYSYRMRSRGYDIVYVPEAEMYHFEGVTTDGTPSLPNLSLIVRHGMLFKTRWKEMFEREGGPPDAAARWRRVEKPPVGRVGPLEQVD